MRRRHAIASLIAGLSVLSALCGVSTSAAAATYTQGGACTLSTPTLSPDGTTTITIAPGNVPAGATISFTVTGSPAATLTPTMVAAGPDGGAHTTLTTPTGASGAYQVTATAPAGAICAITATVLPPDQLRPVTNAGLPDTGINLGLIPWLAGGIILIGATVLLYTRIRHHKPGRHR